MTKEELKQYSELQEKFAKDVLRVVSFLKEIDYDLKFVSEFQLDDGMVYTHGWEYLAFQVRTPNFEVVILTISPWLLHRLPK